MLTMTLCPTDHACFSYFNETGPIYQTELVQANEFSKFVHTHVVVGPHENVKPGQETVRFDWEAFRGAVSSWQGKASEKRCVP